MLTLAPTIAICEHNSELDNAQEPIPLILPRYRVPRHQPVFGGLSHRVVHFKQDSSGTYVLIKCDVRGCGGFVRYEAIVKKEEGGQRWLEVTMPLEDGGVG